MDKHSIAAVTAILVLERELNKGQAIEIGPGYALPIVEDDLYNEKPIDLRAGLTKDELLAELLEQLGG